MTCDFDLLRSILDALPFPLFWKAPAMRYLGCNTSFATMAGLAHPDQVVGLDDYQLPWREDADVYRASDAQVLRSGLPMPDDPERPWNGDGSTRWIQTSKAPPCDAGGSVIGVLDLLVDTTSRAAPLHLRAVVHHQGAGPGHGPGPARGAQPPA